MQVDKRVIESNLLKKGFIKDNNDHRYFLHKYKGKFTTIYTKTSHGSKYKTYDDSLLKMMKKQLRLDTNRQVYELVSCPMSEEQYVEILKSKRVITEE